MLVSGGAALTFKMDFDSYREHEVVQERARIDRRVGVIASRFSDIVSDLRLVSHSGHLSGFFATQAPDELVQVERELAIFIEAKHIYDQARFIDETGMERVRVDFFKDRAWTIAKDKLQNKGSRYFFTDTMKLERGEVFISPFDLNIEGGQIEKPFKPMIRLAMPLFDPSGQRRGISILNYYGNDIFDRLNTAQDKNVAFIELLNQDGFWLKSKRPEREWGFMLGQKETFATEHPDIWQRMQSEPNGQATSDSMLWTWSRIHPLQNGFRSASGSPLPAGASAAAVSAADYHWIAVSHLGTGINSPNQLVVASRYLSLWSVALLLAWFVSWAIALRQGRLNAASTQLSESRQRSELILSVAAEGICGLDLEGRLIFINSAARGMFGWTTEEGMGAHLHAFAHHCQANGKHYPYQDCPVCKVMLDGVTRHVFDEYFWRQDGSGFPVEFTVAAIRQDDQIVGAVLVFHDITERKRIEGELTDHRDHLESQVKARTAELRVAKELAEAANVAKSAFLANMSHEMRTPLHQVSGLANLVRLEPLTPKQVDRMDKLVVACVRLESIINSVLALTRLEAGKLDLREEPFDVAQLLGDALAGARGRAAAKHLNMLADTSIADQLMGDREYIARALGNYLDNAIRFSDTGTISIRAKTLEDDNQRALIRFEVEDEGMGIAPEDLPRLFTNFEQIDNSSTRQYGGLGVGLATTRKIAQIMGGDAGCSSQPGKGSLFWFTVRLKKSVALATFA